jgi:hypothetical protein
VKYWEIIADNLKKRGWSLGLSDYAAGVAEVAKAFFGLSDERVVNF